MIYRQGLENVKWQIPSFYNNDPVALAFLKHFQFYLGKSSNITTTYGSPVANWNSGRVGKFKYDRELFKSTVMQYNHLGVNVYLTANAYDISKEDLEDLACNEMLSYLNDVSYDFSPCQNGVIVSSCRLMEYIRVHYPRLKVEASVLLPIYRKHHTGEDDSPEFYDLMTQGFDLVVPRPEFLLFSDDIDFENPERFVALVNQMCRQNCTMACDHYDFYRDHDLQSGKKWALDLCTDQDCFYHPVNIEYNQMLYLIKHGIEIFKLQGRNIRSDDFLHMLGEYVFEPTSSVFQHLINIARNALR